MVWHPPVPSSQAQSRQRQDILRLCCALCGADRDSARRLCAAPEQPVDWRALVAVAVEFRLVLLLHRAVRSHLADVADPAAVQALDRLRVDGRERAQAMTAELLSVLDRLASQGIAAIPYKGPAFGAQLYGDIGLRTYTDLDVLIRHADLARVGAVMHDAGYRQGDTLSWEISFERIGGASVDVHWAIAEPLHRFPLTADELWARRASVDLAGTSVPTLDLEDALLVICFNGLSEDWQRVDRIADVAELVRGNAPLDWPGLLERCRRKGCERIVLLGLHLARELFRVRLPDAVAHRLQVHRAALAKAGYELDDYLRFATESTDRRQGADNWRFMLRMRERARERIPYLQAIGYDIFKPKAGDAAWLKLSRRALFAMLRLPLLGVKRGLIALGHHELK